MEVNFFKEITDGAIYYWVKLPGKISVCVAINEDIGEIDAIKRAINYWNRKNKIDKSITLLKEKYPDKQIYLGFLPSGDCEFKGEFGQYVYILKDKRKNKKFQIKDALKID